MREGNIQKTLWLVLYGTYVLWTFLWGESNFGWERFVENLLVSVNGLFFMISGNELLESYRGSLKEYFWGLVKFLLIPLCLGTFVSLVSQIGFSVSFGFAKDFLKGLLLGTVEEEYWMLYTLIGYALVAPFFHRMLYSMPERDKRQLLYLMLGYFGFFTTGVILGYKIAIFEYPFLSWLAYFIMGFLVRHISWSEKERKGLYLLGCSALLISSAEAVCFEGINWVLDSFCISRAGICILLYLLSGSKQVEDSRKKDNKIGEGIRYAVFLLLPIVVRKAGTVI